MDAREIASRDRVVMPSLKSEATKCLLMAVMTLTLSAVCAFVPELALAQVSSVTVPTNAHAKSYGTGWECNL